MHTHQIPSAADWPGLGASRGVRARRGRQPQAVATSRRVIGIAPALCRLQQRTQHTHDGHARYTPPARSERLARDRAGAPRPPHMRHAAAHSARPSAASLLPAARAMAASCRLAPLLAGVGAPLSAPPEPPRAPLRSPLPPPSCLVLLLTANGWIPVRVERGTPIAAPPRSRRRPQGGRQPRACDGEAGAAC